MTVTYSVDHAGASTEVVNVEIAAKSDLCHSAHKMDEKTGIKTTEYVIESGDPAYPAYVTFKATVQKPYDRVLKERRLWMTFSTWVKASDSVTGIDKRYPVSTTWTFVFPPDAPLTAALMDDLAGTAFSWLYPSVTAGERNTSILARLLYGGTEVFD